MTIRLDPKVRLTGVRVRRARTDTCSDLGTLVHLKMPRAGGLLALMPPVEKWVVLLVDPEGLDSLKAPPQIEVYDSQIDAMLHGWRMET